MSRKRITAIVPVRQGSQKIKNKNFKKFAGKNLLRIKLEVLKKIDIIDNIVVNSDSDEALSIASEYGVNEFRREGYFASSECNNSDFFNNLAESTDSDFIMYSPCNTPLILEETYYDFISRFRNGLDRSDSLTTVSIVNRHLWLDGKPINYDPSNAPSTEELPEIVSINSGLSIISKDNMIKHRNIIGSKPSFYKLNDFEAVDVDRPIDFEFAEFLYLKYRS
jgi:CMP-N-acetylneuraminic acid synthetase